MLTAPVDPDAAGQPQPVEAEEGAAPMEVEREGDAASAMMVETSGGSSMSAGPEALMERLLDLLGRPLYTTSSATLDTLLLLIDTVAATLASYEAKRPALQSQAAPASGWAVGGAEQVPGGGGGGHPEGVNAEAEAMTPDSPQQATGSGSGSGSSASSVATPAPGSSSASASASASAGVAGSRDKKPSLTSSSSMAGLLARRDQVACWKRPWRRSCRSARAASSWTLRTGRATSARRWPSSRRAASTTAGPSSSCASVGPTSTIPGDLAKGRMRSIRAGHRSFEPLFTSRP
jgi:hypothetical protein